MLECGQSGCFNSSGLVLLPPGKFYFNNDNLVLIKVHVHVYFQREGFSKSRPFFRRGLDWKNKILIPLHEGGSHWTLVLVDPFIKEIIYFDSFHSNGTYVMESVLHFIQEEHQNAKLPFDISAWKLKSRKDIPKQTDDFSCGLMMIMTAECIGLEKPILYSQDDAALVRQKIQYLLIAESVEDPYIYQINQN